MKIKNKKRQGRRHLVFKNQFWRKKILIVSCQISLSRLTILTQNVLASKQKSTVHVLSKQLHFHKIYEETWNPLWFYRFRVGERVNAKEKPRGLPGTIWTISGAICCYQHTFCTKILTIWNRIWPFRPSQATGLRWFECSAAFAGLWGSTSAQTSEKNNFQFIEA